MFWVYILHVVPEEVNSLNKSQSDHLPYVFLFPTPSSYVTYDKLATNTSPQVTHPETKYTHTLLDDDPKFYP